MRRKLVIAGAKSLAVSADLAVTGGEPDADVWVIEIRRRGAGEFDVRLDEDAHRLVISESELPGRFSS